MSLTKAQIKAIQEIIERHHLIFTYETLGEQALTSAELDTLKRAGLIRPNVRSMALDPVFLGRLVALADRTTARGITYEKLKNAMKKRPITEVEKAAAQFARDRGAAHITGLRDIILRDAKLAAVRASESVVRQTFQTKTAESIIARKTVKEFKTILFDTFDQRARDWERIAHTEINTSIQNGVAKEIANQSDAGMEQLVYKKPNPDACKHCKRVYLHSDGITPKIFKLSQLEETNAGRRAADWMPTIGSVHPWCNCQLIVLPEGHDFKKIKIATEPIEHGGRKYKKGEKVDDIFSDLSSENKKKVGRDVELTFTGETPEPVSDSELKKSYSDLEDDCTCEH